MATRSSLRLSRLSDRAIVVQRQLITFTLQETHFLLPIGWAHRAVVFAQQDLTPEGQVHFGDRSFSLLDVGRTIFGTRSTRSLPMQAKHEGMKEGAIAALLLQQPGAEPSWLLPIDSAPALCRIPEDRFVPLPRTYTVQCVREMTDSSSDYPLHFLIDPLQLMQQAIA